MKLESKCGASFCVDRTSLSRKLRNDRKEECSNMKRIIKSKAVILVSVFVCVVVLLTLTVTVIRGQAKSSDLNETLSLGEKYLQELDYTKSITAFKEAITINEKNVEAYKGLAEAYIGVQQYQDAIDIVTKGIDKTNDSSLKELLEKIQETIKKNQLEQEEMDVNMTILPYSITRSNPTDPIEQTPISQPNIESTSESVMTPQAEATEKPIIRTESTPEEVQDTELEVNPEPTPEITPEPTPIQQEQRRGWKELYKDVIMNIHQYMKDQPSNFSTYSEYIVRIMNLDFKGDPELLISKLQGSSEFEKEQKIFCVENDQVKEVNVNDSSLSTFMGNFRTYRNTNTNQVEWLYNLYTIDGHISDFEDALSELANMDVEKLEYNANGSKTVTIMKYSNDMNMDFQAAKEEYIAKSSVYEPVDTPVYIRKFTVSYEDRSDVSKVTLQFTEEEVIDFLNQY